VFASYSNFCKVHENDEEEKPRNFYKDLLTHKAQGNLLKFGVWPALRGVYKTT